MKKCLLVIDMQNDFVNKDGSLYVPNADIAVDNLIKLLYDKNKFDKIIFTRDAHPLKNISNVNLWKDKEGNTLPPFTVISYNDIIQEKYKTLFSSNFLRKYTKYLEKHSNKKLTLWPQHCIKDTEGYQLHYKLQNFVKNNMDKCVLINKGKSSKTEHYSIFKAEMPLSFDKRTFLNKRLLNTIDQYDEVYICGVATDYCVKESVRIINKYRPNIMKKTIFITNCMASISNIDLNEDEVFKESIKMGAKIV